MVKAASIVGNEMPVVVKDIQKEGGSVELRVSIQKMSCSKDSTLYTRPRQRETTNANAALQREKLARAGKATFLKRPSDGA